MARKWRELAPFYFRATATKPLFINLAPQRRAPPFLVRATVAVALKVVQVPNTGFTFFNIFLIIYVQPSKLLFLFCCNSSFLTVFCPHVSFTYLSLFYDCVSTKKTPKERPSPPPSPKNANLQFHTVHFRTQ